MKLLFADDNPYINKFMKSSFTHLPVLIVKVRSTVILHYLGVCHLTFRTTEKEIAVDSGRLTKATKVRLVKRSVYVQYY